MTPLRVGYLVIDTVDLDGAAGFWSALLEVATRRAEELGGSWDGQDRELDGYHLRCLADVQGNEFDLVRGDCGREHLAHPGSRPATV